VKVVLVTSLERGGPVEQALVLGRALAAGGVEVTAVCATPELARRFAGAGCESVLVPLRHQLDVGAARRIARLARGADVIHGHDRRSGLWTRIGRRPRPGGLRIYTVHGVPEEYHPPPIGPERPGAKATLLYRGLEAKLSWRADATIVPSQAIARDLVGRLGFPADRLEVIPNGIELDPPPARRGELVGTFSVLERFKGVDVFLRAAAQLAAERPGLRFATFGTGSQAAPLRELAGTLGLDGRVEQPGFVPRAEAFAQLGVYVLSSFWENAPMALLEAMAARVPIVATSVYGVPEIVDESTARLVPPGDPAAMARAIAEVLDDPAATDARADAALERVKVRFSAEANARAILGLYERLLR